MSRSVGIKRDLRLNKLETYGNYYYLNFRSFLGQHGDSYDRFLIRMNEMVESLNICNQIIYKITKFNKNYFKKYKNNNLLEQIVTVSPHNVLKYLNLKNFNNNNIKTGYNTMESLINHFKY
jgi:NADH:ubiquinone oxidoreductase subunit D